MLYKKNSYILYIFALLAENEQGTSYNWSTNYNSYADSSDANSSQVYL